jgi:two-component system sensor histidine kinase VicK
VQILIVADEANLDTIVTDEKREGQQEEETTEFFYGGENTLPAVISLMSRTNKFYYSLIDSTALSVALGHEPVRKAYAQMKKRGVKIKWITEITKDNLLSCKKAMSAEYGVEIRHVNCAKGNFAVTESEYFEAANPEGANAFQVLAVGAIKAFQNNRRCVFDILWNKAIPAEQRIEELQGEEPEITRIISGDNATTNAILDFILSAKEGWCDCGDKYMPSIAIEVPQIRYAIEEARRKGLRLMYITEIEKNNLKYCKRLAQLVELRHLSNVKVNFAVSKTHYMSATTLVNKDPVPEVIYSNVKTLVIQHQFTFETLWDRSIPAEQRIKELEEGLLPERTEVIHDSHLTENAYKQIINGAREEILLIFPTSNVFERSKKIGLIDALIRAAQRGVKVRIIANVDEESEIHNQSILNLKSHNILVNQLLTSKEEMQAATEVNAVIADNKTSLIIELIDDNKDDFAQAIGPAVLSTGKALASSYARFFNSLWLETSLSARVKEMERIQNEFVNTAAHEWRTPITPIIITLDTIDERTKREEPIVLTRKQLDIMMRSAKRLQNLAGNILIVSKIEAKGLTLFRETGDLNEWIREELSTSIDAIPRNTKIDIIFEPDRADSPMLIWADKSKVLEVISNLLRNAIRSCQNNGTIKVTSQTSKDGAFAIVSVIDDGKGIDARIMPQLFHKFSTLHTTGSTGLGLYICKSIVEAHRGTIKGENNISSKGATFTFTLPLMGV